jgi:hypothetical protein
MSTKRRQLAAGASGGTALAARCGRIPGRNPNPDPIGLAIPVPLSRAASVDRAPRLPRGDDPVRLGLPMRDSPTRDRGSPRRCRVARPLPTTVLALHERLGPAISAGYRTQQ